MYKSSINKILLSISKEHTAHLVVTEMSPFVSFSAVLFFSQLPVAPSKGGRVLRCVVVTIHQWIRRKKSWHVNHGCNILTPCFPLHTFSPRIVISFSFFCNFFFFFVTWQRSENCSLYVSTPWWWVANELPTTSHRRAESGRKWNCSVAATREILSTSGAPGRNRRVKAAVELMI